MLNIGKIVSFFFFSSRRRHTRSLCDWSSDVCSSDLGDQLDDDLDLVMFDLRSSFARRYHGWVPTMGKNRFVSGTQGLGEIGGGGPNPGPGDGGGGEKGLDTLPEGETFTLSMIK